ncbi:hypothetical protein EV421DRAFT_1889433 [Armillaria borealis]|uniref:CxC1-like cysteine cluster associated with KDZ transposases domain-containing protein n=1 Tax=Armillaria borealis TaxID=47425 RepID=A0AA39JU97_9AGAR|nr:hypothetical protein EV421DRAFT_1889433 [Armillaria borealis]
MKTGSADGRVTIRQLGVGRHKPHREVLTPAQIRKQKEGEFQEQTQRIVGKPDSCSYPPLLSSASKEMTREELQQLHNLHSLPVEADDGWEDDGTRFEGIFAGEEQMDISNAGGEFIDVLNEVAREWEGQNAGKRRAHDRFRQGLIPCAAIAHAAAVSTRTLEVFRRTQLHSPHLSTQAFIRMLCDLHQCPYRSYFATQFTVAFDVYCSILCEVERDEADHRIKNACPCCMYELEGEMKLTYRLLFCMDGNDSLKRILQRNTDDSNGKDADRESSPCSDRWKNMINNMTSKAWGIFDETGVFVALCRHGFVLITADMVRSGELVKYPLAIVEHLLKTLGADLGGGYDIGCKFGTTLSRSPLSSLASEKWYKSLVSGFHGHAHCRLCQTTHLTTYCPGVGCEDLEGCKRLFSKTEQMMDETDTYESLSHFLCNNYRQALDILQDQHALQHTMAQQGIDSEEVFHWWLAEERDYLTKLQGEPVEETLQMEYFEKLVSLFQSQAKLDQARAVWTVDTPETLTGPIRDRTQSIENARRHAQEKCDHLLDEVHILISKLQIVRRWMPGMAEWQEVGDMVCRRRYRHAVDALEALVVVRLFKLTKMNMSETGYKQCKHIAKALQARSQAVRTAHLPLVDTPPPPQLTWDDVVHYAFLSDFDLLRESHTNVRDKPWAKPVGRLTMDQYFKIQRAKEEIDRLNVEIRRLTTYIQDEDRFLCKKIEEYSTTDPRTAFQIDKHRRSHARFNDRHIRHLVHLASEPGFTGTITPGVRLGMQPSEGIDAASALSSDRGSLHKNEEGWGEALKDDDVGPGDEEDDEELGRQLMAMARVSDD